MHRRSNKLTAAAGFADRKPVCSVETYAEEKLLLGKEACGAVRRSDREITDLDLICEGIRKCDTCRLGLVEDGLAYIVPMSFGFERRGDRLFFYFHSAKEGRKIELMKKNEKVSFELDQAHMLKEGKKACDYGMKYQCIMGSGKITFLEGEEKLAGLCCLMEHYTEQKTLEYQSAVVDQVQVFRLEAEEISCKECK